MMDNSNAHFLSDIPVLGICGWSGAGKTTLIESIVRNQTALGRRICVIKHDAHQIQVDREGKDSFRFFRSGADVVVTNPDEFFFRGHHGDRWDLLRTIRSLARWYDGFLVEGHKHSRLPRKIWLCHPENSDVPEVANGFEDVIERNNTAPGKVSALFETILTECWQRSPVSGAVLIGGESSRFGMAKHLMKSGSATWVERIVDAMAQHLSSIVLIGRGAVPESLSMLPRLPDVPGAAGPIAGIRAAFRWNPGTSWIVAPCDVPQLHGDAIAWLLNQRAIGRDAVLPVLDEDRPVEPLPAYYDYRCGPFWEEIVSPRRIADVARICRPVVPPPLRESWHNVNSHLDLV
jgi:molybdopterin-guanine dinucleotide biosynthesis protein MobB